MEDDTLKLPSFNEFVSNINVDEMNYDMERFATQRIKYGTAPFTHEQYLLLSETIFTTQLSILAQYHQWLSEQLSE